ncbi:MAG TPA: serine/threonine-protein kinase [Kofleriaceae bacterium]
MADCQMCGGTHADDPGACPQCRTGQQHDKYVIGPLLGVGGIAAVYSATHPVLGREVALKIIHKRFAKDVELSSRFVREARETAALGHPAFVRVYDAGTTADGCAFIEMDRLTGRELYEMRKEQGPFPAERVVQLAIKILDAVAALHARGVIHRDLKSQNLYIMPSPNGEQVTLLDLGFAKVEDNMKLTSKDHILGTPLYISPEQYLDPSAVDGRADLFSIGVIMFELLTGQWPYEWENKRDLLSRVMKGNLERHPRTKREDVPIWLDEIVAKGLSLAREDRFASALEMKAALEAGEPPRKSGLIGRLFG